MDDEDLFGIFETVFNDPSESETLCHDIQSNERLQREVKVLQKATAKEKNVKAKRANSAHLMHKDILFLRRITALQAKASDDAKKLEEGDENIRNLQQQLQQSENATIYSLQTFVAEKDEELQGLRLSDTMKDEELQGLRASAAKKDEELQGLRASVAEKDEKLEDLQASVANKDEKLKALRTSDTAKGKKLGEWKALIAQKDKELETLRNNATQRQSTDILSIKGEILDHLEGTDERVLRPNKLLTKKEAKILELTNQATQQEKANDFQVKKLEAREENINAKEKAYAEKEGELEVREQGIDAQEKAYSKKVEAHTKNEKKWHGEVKLLREELDAEVKVHTQKEKAHAEKEREWDRNAKLQREKLDVEIKAHLKKEKDPKGKVEVHTKKERDWDSELKLQHEKLDAKVKAHSKKKRGWKDEWVGEQSKLTKEITRLTTLNQTLEEAVEQGVNTTNHLKEELRAVGSSWRHIIYSAYDLFSVRRPHMEEGLEFRPTVKGATNSYLQQLQQLASELHENRDTWKAAFEQAEGMITAFKEEVYRLQYTNNVLKADIKTVDEAAILLLHRYETDIGQLQALSEGHQGCNSKIKKAIGVIEKAEKDVMEQWGNWKAKER